MDYIAALDANFSPFRLLLLDIVQVLHEQFNLPFVSERSCAMVCYMVYVSPA